MSKPQCWEDLFYAYIVSRDPNRLSPRPKPKPCNNQYSVELKKSEPIRLHTNFLVYDFVVNKFKLYCNQKHQFFFQEFFNTLLLTVLYTVAFIVQISAWSRPYQSYYRNPNIAAGVSVLYMAILQSDKFNSRRTILSWIMLKFLKMYNFFFHKF